MATKKIEKLTKAQEADLRETYLRWLEIGRSVQPVDRAAATEAICKMYEAAGKKRPAVLFFSSPLMCIVAWGALSSKKILSEPSVKGQLSGQLWDQLRDQLSDQLRDQLSGQLSDQLRGQLRGQLSGQLWDQLWDQLRGQLRDQLRGQLRGQLSGQLSDQLRGQLWGQLSDQLRDQLSDQLRDQLWGQLRDQLRGQLRDQLSGQLSDQLRDQLSDQLRDQLSGQLRDQLWGQLSGQLWDQLWDQLRGQLSNYFAGSHWAAWEVFYDFCKKIGVRYNEWQSTTLDLWIQQSLNCHWWWPYEGIVLASERPTICRTDDRGRLHSMEGPALGYSDGWGVYASHGVRLPADIIENPASIDVRRIDAEPNAEIRRVMVELYGPGKFIMDAGAKCIGHDGHGILWRRDLPDDEPIVMVEVFNPTAEPDGHLTKAEAMARFTADVRDGKQVHLHRSMAYVHSDPEDARYKRYFLRVHPECRPMIRDRAAPNGFRLGEPQKVTPHAAVASTYGKTALQYDPDIRT